MNLARRLSGSRIYPALLFSSGIHARASLLALGLVLAFPAEAQRPGELPRENPLKLHYADEGYPAWTDDLHWDRVVDMSKYRRGRSDFERFENARDELAASDGGVLYYPAGTYDFSDAPMDGPQGRGLFLKRGVVLRGQAPIDPRAEDLALTTRFHFGFASSTEKPTGRDWAFIGLQPRAGEELRHVDHVGVAWIHLVGGTIFFGPQLEWGPTWATSGGWRSSRAKPAWRDRVADGLHPLDAFAGGGEALVGSGSGRLVFGCAIEDGAVVNRALDEGFGEDGFSTDRFAARVAVYGSRVLVANNRLPPPTRAFRYSQKTSSGEIRELLYDRGKTLGIDVNKELLGRARDGYFEEGIVVRDNVVFNHGHKGFNVAGRWVSILDNRNDRWYLREGAPVYGLGDGWELTLDGYRESMAGGSGSRSDNLSRAFDLAGQALWVDGNVYSDLGSDPGNDGEGILCQLHAGTNMLSWAITHNTHHLGEGEAGYIGGYDVDQIGALIAWNRLPGAVGNFKAGRLVDATYVMNQAARVSTTGDDTVTDCPSTVPSPPDQVVARGFNDFVRITWSDRSTQEIGYRVDRRLADGDWRTIAYRPRQSGLSWENQPAWDDHLLPRGVTARYRVASVGCDDGDQGAAEAAGEVVLPSRSGLSQDRPARSWKAIDGLRLGFSEAEVGYEERLHRLVSAKDWPIGKGNRSIDAGKWDWSALLAELWKARDQPARREALIREQGGVLVRSPWAGTYQRPFSAPGHTLYYFAYEDALPESQREEMRDMVRREGWDQMSRADSRLDHLFEVAELDSENFRLMFDLAGFLWSEEIGDRRRRARYRDLFRNWVRSLFYVGRAEWGAGNYWAYSAQPAFLVHDYAKSRSDRRRARAALDWLALEMALHSLDGFQVGPQSRAKADSHQPFRDSAWFYSYLYGFGADSDEIDAAAERNADFRLVGFAPHSSYRPPRAILDVARRRFQTPVEIRSAKPFYRLNWNDYAGFAGDSENSRRFEFETLYLERDYTLGSVASLKPDGDAVLESSGHRPFPELKVWSLAVRREGKPPLQIFGNTGSSDLPIGRSPHEQIGQHRGVLVRLARHAERLWVVVPKDTVVDIREGLVTAQLTPEVYVAWISAGTGKPTSHPYPQDDAYLQLQWQTSPDRLGVLVMEVRHRSQHGSLDDFVSAIAVRHRLQIRDESTVEYKSTRQDHLRLQYQPATTYRLLDGTVVDPAGVLPRFWINGRAVRYESWNAWETVHGQPLVHQEWGSGELRIDTESRSLRIRVRREDAAVDYAIATADLSN